MDRKGPFVMSLACVLILALMAPTFALAKGPGGGGGGGGHEPGATNNLSVPLINIGGSWTGVTCPLAEEVLPTGTPLDGYEISPADFYYVQSVHTWQAECITATSASAGALWGDNLAGDAKLKVGMPIRVEIGLETPSAGMDGFTVVKLEPSELDRNAAYGTLATCDTEMNCSATVTTFTSVRVFDSGAMWRVLDADGLPARDWEAIGSEINATGKAVYGYNLRLPEAGAYTLEFRFPNVTITGVNYGTFECADGVCVTSLPITVISGGGGGGGGKPH